MELNHGRHKASKIASEDLDFISSMPDNVVTHILDRMPLQYAMRTSVLSRNWRFKWTMLSQLIFDNNFFAYLSKTESKNNDVRIIISRILLSLRGGITKFVLSIDGRLLDAEDINHWMLFLCRKGIKDLTCQIMKTRQLKLPTHLFSCLELKHLKLSNCRFRTPPSFHGFPNLLSLYLGYVELDSGKVGDLFTQCPVLEILILTTKVKLDEISKLENLKILSLYLHDDPGMIKNSSNIFELVDCLPKLQELRLYFLSCKLTEGDAKKRFPTAFSSLKVLELSRIDLDNAMELSFALELIKSFPNLQTLEIITHITASTWDDASKNEICFPEVDYNAMGPLQLRNVVFTTCGNYSEKDVSLIKFLLTCSPFLRKLVIHPHVLVDLHDKFLFSKKLVKLQRAFPAVDFDLSQF